MLKQVNIFLLFAFTALLKLVTLVFIWDCSLGFHVFSFLFRDRWKAFLFTQKMRVGAVMKLVVILLRILLWLSTNLFYNFYCFLVHNFFVLFYFGKLKCLQEQISQQERGSETVIRLSLLYSAYFCLRNWFTVNTVVNLPNWSYNF